MANANGDIFFALIGSGFIHHYLPELSVKYS